MVWVQGPTLAHCEARLVSLHLTSQCALEVEQCLPLIMGVTFLFPVGAGTVITTYT